MSKRFVKKRFPEAFATKTYGWLLGNPFIIYDKKGGSILKGSDVTERQAWANLKEIIQKQEKAEKLLSENEIKEKRLQTAILEVRELKNKYFKLFGENSVKFKFFKNTEEKLISDLKNYTNFCITFRNKNGNVAQLVEH